MATRILPYLLAGLQPALVSTRWGYNTPAERLAAQKEDRVTLLSIDRFGQD